MNTQQTLNTQQPNAIEVPVPDLKPERVQERLRRERAQQAVKTMPGWELTPDAKAIHRARPKSPASSAPTSPASREHCRCPWPSTTPVGTW